MRQIQLSIVALGDDREQALLCAEAALEHAERSELSGMDADLFEWKFRHSDTGAVVASEREHRLSRAVQEAVTLLRDSEEYPLCASAAARELEDAYSAARGKE